jgi:uncharacterized protein YhbP (UPF0306 family)
MKNLKKLIDEILTDGFVMTLATSQKNIPWAADLGYVHDEKFNIYWISYANTRHSKDIEANSVVAATICASTKGEEDKAVQIQGKASRLAKKDILKAASLYNKREGKPAPKTLEEVEAQAEGRIWYQLVPTKIYVHYEPLFGYDRKEYTP